MEGGFPILQKNYAMTNFLDRLNYIHADNVVIRYVRANGDHQFGSLVLINGEDFILDLLVGGNGHDI